MTDLTHDTKAMSPEQLKPIIEAALLAANQPLTVMQLVDLFIEEEGVGREHIARSLEVLADDCRDRGVELKEVASGFRYQVRAEVHPWVSRLWTEKPSRYSRALLETLSLIAYRQPITRPEIEQIRGVVVSSSIIKTLEEREWIRVVGHRDVPGRPALFATTRSFLDYFNLKSLDELPPLAEIRDMEDPQMRLDQQPLPVRIARDLPLDPDQLDVANGGSDQPPVASADTDPTDMDASGAPPETTDDDALRNADKSAPDIRHPQPTERASHSDSLGETSTTPIATADEAANRADAEPGDAEQPPQEYRA